MSVLRESFAEFESQYTPKAFAASAVDEAQARERMAIGLTWGAFLGNMMIGTASVSEKDEDILYVRGMAVVPSARGKGVGRLLLERIESHAKQRGRKRLQLRTSPCLTAAIQLYERFGFRPDERSIDLFGTPLIGMTKELCSEKSEDVNKGDHTCRKTTDTTPPAFA